MPAIDYVVSIARGEGGLTAIELGGARNALIAQGLELPGSLSGVPDNWLLYACGARNNSALGHRHATIQDGSGPAQAGGSIRVNRLRQHACTPGESGDAQLVESARFLRCNIALALLLIFGLAYAARGILVKQFVRGIHEIGPAAFLIRSEAIGVSKQRFVDFIVEAS